MAAQVRTNAPNDIAELEDEFAIMLQATNRSPATIATYVTGVRGTVASSTLVTSTTPGPTSRRTPVAYLNVTSVSPSNGSALPSREGRPMDSAVEASRRS